MKSILIRDTTREERAAIVAEAIGNIEGACDGCAPGIIRMYEAYIDGRTDLREVNAAVRAGYVSGKEGPERTGCEML